MNRNRHWQQQGWVDDPATFQQPGEKRAQTPGKAGAFPAQPRQGKTSSAIPCALPAAFHTKAQLLVTGESPKACRDRDAPLETSHQAEGQHGWGLNTILCLAREDLGAPEEARHKLATGLAVPPRGVVPEPGSSLAWRHPLPSSGDKELELGGPRQDLGFLGQSGLESWPGGNSSLFRSTRSRMVLLPGSSQPSAEGITACESRPW